MMKMIAALCVAVPCAASAQASQQRASATMADGPLTLEQAVAAAGGSAPMTEAASAGVEAARAARTTAALRPNPSLQGQVENVVGSGPYRSLRSAETTLGVALPIELGGKRGARIAVADAQLSRAELQAAMTAADVRYQITQLYVEAVAAARRLSTARDQYRVAGDALHAAQVRVQAGRASPLEEQRAMVAQALSLARLEQTERLAGATRENLARRIGRPVDGPLDDACLDALPPATYGLSAVPLATGTLTLAAAEADLAVADANVRLSRAARVPDLTVGPALRRLSATNDTAAVFSVSLPIPLFNAGRSALAQARSERVRADAQRRATALDVEQAITDASAEVANAAASARAASGPAMTAAAEAARIARIGYREGKFGQLDLLDAERTLADTRLAAIDALATYHNARARLERLTAPVPQGETLP